MSNVRTGIMAIVWFLLAVAFLLAAPVLFEWTSWLFWGVCVVAVLLAAILVWLARVLAGRKWSFARTSAALICLLAILVATPVYYLAIKVEADPVLLPQVTMSDGQRTVVLQGMIHVGSESFFKSVVYDLENALANGYTLYYEKVKSSPGAGDEWLSRYVGGGGDLTENYQNISSACGLKFQLDYFALMDKQIEENPEKNVIADVSSLDLKNEFDRLARADPAFAEAVAPLADQAGGSASEATRQLLDKVKNGTPGQKKLFGIACRGFITYMLEQQVRGEKHNPLKPVILDFRNRKLVERLLADPADRVYVTYGAAHLPGVVRLLQQASPPWHVETVKWLRGMKTPEQLEGEMDFSPLPSAP